MTKQIESYFIMNYCKYVKDPLIGKYPKVIIENSHGIRFKISYKIYEIESFYTLPDF